jgi:hypothetical protein
MGQHCQLQVTAQQCQLVDWDPAAVAAIAEPPQIEVPTPIKVVILPSTLSIFPTK